MTDSVRWQQRFQNFTRALLQLKEAVLLHGQRPLSNLEKQGFIKAFEFTHELAWKVMKDFAIYQGNNQIMGSRDATREAFKNEMVIDGEGWMEMIKDRNRAVHTYDEESAIVLIDRTVSVYYPLFVAFKKRMEGLADDA
jgi:nucleotidyltransferase substrate binding protein (TIGR01987 family)